MLPTFRPAELAEFLDAGPPVFFGIGSMRPDDAGHVRGLAATAGQQAGVRMVIQDTSAGTVASAGEVLVIGDQPFWAARLAQLGGPAASLTAAIAEVTTRGGYRDRASFLAGRLAREDGTAPVISALARLSG